MKLKRIVAIIITSLVLSSNMVGLAFAQDEPGPSPVSPVIGICAPLPDTILYDWTAKFLEVVIGGDWHRQPCGA
jgi:hypothetical protein